MTFESKRNFKKWCSVVSLGQMLIRSPPDDENMNNVDVVFFGVTFVSMPTYFRGLRIYKKETSDETNLAFEKHRGENDDVFVLESENEKYFVIANGCVVYENFLGLFETSLGQVGISKEEPNLGKLRAII